jgi:hypothetical protein
VDSGEHATGGFGDWLGGGFGDWLGGGFGDWLGGGFGDWLGGGFGCAASSCWPAISVVATAPELMIAKIMKTNTLLLLSPILMGVYEVL